LGHNGAGKNDQHPHALGFTRARYRPCRTDGT
jgi:hypothetical protein